MCINLQVWTHIHANVCIKCTSRILAIKLEPFVTWKIFLKFHIKKRFHWAHNRHLYNNSFDYELERWEDPSGVSMSERLKKLVIQRCNSPRSHYLFIYLWRSMRNLKPVCVCGAFGFGFVMIGIELRSKDTRNDISAGTDRVSSTEFAGLCNWWSVKKRAWTVKEGDVALEED